MNGKKVKVWEEIREIPTYGIGKPDKNPMFLEKRVYQGSSGRVYPYPVIDKILDEKKDQPYTLVILENEYIRVEIMPELGGRIYRALDKTNQYDFVYYNRVIKPALVGLAGPWISGGIEFNWPQHHRPNTFGPVEYSYEENGDGSATVWVSEIDRMYGTKMTAGFRLFPGKAYLEITGQLYNRTALPQTFLWWANPAYAVNDNTQSVFPPDVTAVFDHGKRDVSRFPIATGTYYKMDYSAGVDISRYKNIPVPTSYMAYRSDYDFVGGYDHGVRAGLLHIANHHISPGKKQWTWGCGDFGRAWDRNLTDEDGPYIELMTGVYTDNQPDFSWLMPYEEKSFTQYFMPYKEIGVIKNATIEAAVNLEVDESNRMASVRCYVTSEMDVIIELRTDHDRLLSEEAHLSPVRTYRREVAIPEEIEPHALRVTVRDMKGRLIVAYQPKAPQIEAFPEAAKPLPEPKEIQTNEKLYLAGLHLEQYRHATYEPDPYYLEGLKRDPDDIRINNAYGSLLLRRGLFKESEEYFRRAIGSLTWRNPNPYDSEAYFLLGVALKYQNRLREAFDAFYKAVWSAAWQDGGYFALAQIAAIGEAYEEGLELIERSLTRNTRNYKARHLKTALLRKLGRCAEAISFAEETIRLDKADFASHYEVYLLHEQANKREKASAALENFTRLLRDDAHNYLHLAYDYAESGMYQEAVRLLGLPKRSGNPLVLYTLGDLYEKLGEGEKAKKYREAARLAPGDYCFPNLTQHALVLQSALQANPEDDKAHYYLGNLLYDKKRVDEAIRHWEASRSINPGFATVHRNLALAYYNKRGDGDAARISLERAFSLSPADARLLFELDQLYKKMGKPPEERFSFLNGYLPLVEERDDLYVEYVTILNSLGRYDEALLKLAQRHFHPWEGGEGKATGQYVLAHVELAKRFIEVGNDEEALRHLKEALHYPINLGEGKLAGAQENHIYYYMGLAYEGLHKQAEAEESYRHASHGIEEPASAMFYNDQPPDMIFYQGLAWRKLGNEAEALRRFNKLIDYGEKHFHDDVKIDYFAVSLPDFLVFDEDMNKRNRIHCRYLLGLGFLGLGKRKKAEAELAEVLRLDVNHQGARIHRTWVG